MYTYVVVSRVCEPYESDVLDEVSVHETPEEAFKNKPENTKGYLDTYYHVEIREKN